MSKIYFECSVKYRTTNESGAQQVVTRPYLVDAISFTEAESRINEEMKSHISEDFRVTNIKLTNYSEIAAVEDADRWFKSKVSLIAYDEETGKERKANIYLLVQAVDAKDAYDNTIASMKGTMSEYSIPSVSETNIREVFSYVGDKE
jgi:hypothetical protein